MFKRPSLWFALGGALAAFYGSDAAGAPQWLLLFLTFVGAISGSVIGQLLKSKREPPPNL